MKRMTIDYGIDLGTTNSAIAVIDPGQPPKVIDNNDNERITPSVVGVAKNGRLLVGKRAYHMMASRNLEEQENVKKEFKRQMGTSDVTVFPRLNRKFRPEDFSAEVLKELRASVQRKRGDEVDAAIVTIPAAFQQPQIAATRKAAELAGLVSCELIQEPVAAALAYGLLDSKAKGYWIVYDMGGGTFDAALLQLQDGIVRIANHCGDNHLGGKDIDNLILGRVILPAIEVECDIPDFNRGNRRYKFAIPPILYHVEQAKIELSRSDTAYVQDIPEKLIDSCGNVLSLQGFEYELSREDVNPFVEAIIIRSLVPRPDTWTQV